jgi:hypothetical protein
MFKIVMVQLIKAVHVRDMNNHLMMKIKLMMIHLIRCQCNS